MPAAPRLVALALFTATFWAAPAHAQDVYAGAVYEAGSGTLSLGSSTDTKSQSFVGLTGIRFSVSGPLYAGGEIEKSLSFDLKTDGGMKIDANGPLRYRAVAGVELQGFSVFFSAGQARIDTPTDSFSGTSLGIGVEVPVGKRTSVRVEAIHDALSDPNFGHELDSQSIRAGAVINF